MTTQQQLAAFNNLIATANLAKIGDKMLSLPTMSDGRYTQYVYRLRVLRMYGISGTMTCPGCNKSYSDVLEQYAVSAYLGNLWKAAQTNPIN